MATRLSEKLKEDKEKSRKAANDIFDKVKAIGMRQPRPDVYWQTLFCLMGYEPGQHIQISKNVEDDVKFL